MRPSRSATWIGSRLGGGIASAPHGISGQYFRDRYGSKEEANPAYQEMLRTGRSRAERTTRVASYNRLNPLLARDGETVGGCISTTRSPFGSMEALRLWTVGNSWFSTEQGSKGSVVPGNTVSRCFPQLFFGGRRGGPEPRIGADDWAASRYAAGIRRTRAPTSTRAAGMVSGRGVWRLRQTRHSAGCSVRPWSIRIAATIGVTISNLAGIRLLLLGANPIHCSEEHPNVYETIPDDSYCLVLAGDRICHGRGFNFGVGARYDTLTCMSSRKTSTSSWPACWPRSAGPQPSRESSR